LWKAIYCSSRRGMIDGWRGCWGILSDIVLRGGMEKIPYRSSQVYNGFQSNFYQSLGQVQPWNGPHIPVTTLTGPFRFLQNFLTVRYKEDIRNTGVYIQRASSVLDSSGTYHLRSQVQVVARSGRFSKAGGSGLTLFVCLVQHSQ
jgi:hypothetical protein